MQPPKPHIHENGNGFGGVFMSFFTKTDRMSHPRWEFAFFGGFLLGIAFVCLTYQTMVWNTDFLGRESFIRISQLEINKNGLFFYVICNRLECVAFLLLFSAAGMAGVVCMLFAGWSGITSGIMLTVLSIRYGIKGIFLFCGCIFPQQLFLIPGFWLLFEVCCIKKQKRHVVFSVAAIMVGCVVEAYINPVFLKLILKIFPV